MCVYVILCVLFASFRFSTRFSNSLPSSRRSPSTAVIYSLWIRWFYKNVLAFFVLSSFFRSHCSVLLPLLLFYILSFTSLHVYVALYERLSFFLFVLVFAVNIIASSLFISALASSSCKHTSFVCVLRFIPFSSLLQLSRSAFSYWAFMFIFFCGLSSVFLLLALLHTHRIATVGLTSVHLANWSKSYQTNLPNRARAIAVDPATTEPRCKPPFCHPRKPEFILTYKKKPPFYTPQCVIESRIFSFFRSLVLPPRLRFGNGAHTAGDCAHVRQRK